MNPIQLAEIKQRARRERAKHVAALIGKGVRRLALFGRRIRQLAAQCTAARLGQQ